MSYNAIIIDDEALAITELEVMLKNFPEISVIGKSERASEAVQLVNDLHPDLIFLDINMPGMNGFELLEELEEVPEVIFVTAYDEHAIKAFEINALDYLLKPVNPARLAEAVKRLEKKSEKIREKSESDRLSLDKRIFIKDGEKCFFVPVADIFLLESEGNYVKVHFGDKKPLLHKSLTYMENRLPSDVFFRANRQYMFNMNFVKKIDPYFNSTLLVELQSGHKIDLSQRQSVKFRDITGV
ncbi:LytR/AlgR family response regulator transcription factor [Pararhodonellum marinum]|uniref:LytR/AlgR family response regulator transcription factor n=1 Tax=Pararhodonellum marinum TaxID=2755358 RepID=UPI00188F450D|nr:response regulator [Pararhodonellum marinum]